MTLEYSRITLPPLLTLAQAKTHLHLTGTTEDADVQQKLDAAQEIVIGFLGVSADPTWDATSAPYAVTAAIRLMLAYLYEDRGDGNTPDVWPKIWNLLGTYRDPVVG